MNLPLLDPFVLTQDLPETVVGKLRRHCSAQAAQLSHTCLQHKQAADTRHPFASIDEAISSPQDGYVFVEAKHDKVDLGDNANVLIARWYGGHLRSRDQWSRAQA